MGEGERGKGKGVCPRVVLGNEQRSELRGVREKQCSSRGVCARSSRMRGSTPNTAILQQHREKRVCPQSGTTCTALASEGGDDADRSEGRERSSVRNEWSALAASSRVCSPSLSLFHRFAPSVTRLLPLPESYMTALTRQTQRRRRPLLLNSAPFFFFSSRARAFSSARAHAHAHAAKHCTSAPRSVTVPTAANPPAIAPLSLPMLLSSSPYASPLSLPLLLLYCPVSSSSLPMPPSLVLLFLFLFPYPLSTLCCRRPSRPSRPP